MQFYLYMSLAFCLSACTTEQNLDSFVQPAHPIYADEIAPDELELRVSRLPAANVETRSIAGSVSDPSTTETFDVRPESPANHLLESEPSHSVEEAGDTYSAGSTISQEPNLAEPSETVASDLEEPVIESLERAQAPNDTGAIEPVDEFGADRTDQPLDENSILPSAQTDNTNETQCPCPDNEVVQETQEPFDGQRDSWGEQFRRILFDSSNGSRLSDGVLLEVISATVGATVAFALGVFAVRFNNVRAQRKRLALTLLNQVFQYKAFENMRAKEAIQYRRDRYNDIIRELEIAESQGFLTDEMETKIVTFRDLLTTFHTKESSVVPANDNVPEWQNLTQDQKEAWFPIAPAFIAMVSEIYPKGKKLFDEREEELGTIKGESRRDKSYWEKFWAIVFSPLQAVQRAVENRKKSATPISR